MGYYEQALAIDREIGDRRGEGADLGNMGLAYAALGEARKAIGYYEQQLVIVREIGDRQGACAALGNMAVAWRQLGEPQKALACHREALRLALEAQDPLRTVQLAWQLAPVYEDLGDLPRAVALAAFAASRFKDMQYPQAQSAMADLARYQKTMGKAPFTKALQAAEATLQQIFSEILKG
ncbi:MAG: tetratricopeptide repeat protein [Planctomycetes bacterium]|nr:tetratricopeptide repeat protein [Planctomycetota bacterium]